MHFLGIAAGLNNPRFGVLHVGPQRPGAWDPADERFIPIA
jgi:hypothetical protein